MRLSTQWLKDYVDYRGNAEKVAEDLTMAGLEVEKITTVEGVPGHTFEIEVTTNRPDWISHFGVAREIAAVQKLPLKISRPKVHAKGASPKSWKVTTLDKEKCPYYTAILIEGIEQGPTPRFMRDRLAACGLRSIGLIVDITNYVLLETGQPLHAFDAGLLNANEVYARPAGAKEKFTAIDGSVHELSSDDLVIADGKSPVALAGVMGGKDSEVSPQTKDVLLESAFFQPRTVRMSSKTHALASDSSYRFERRVDPEGVDFARDRAVELIVEYAKPKKVHGVLKTGAKPKSFSKQIAITVLEVERALGVEIKQAEIVAILKRLGLKSVVKKKGQLSVSVPTFRPDLTRSVDLVEEIARIYGYHRIPETLPKGISFHPEVDDKLQLEEDLRKHLCQTGFFEAVTFSLISDKGLGIDKNYKKAVKIQNPQNKELCWMRPTLATSLLGVVSNNLHLKAKCVPIYEIANTYEQTSAKGLPRETKVLAIALYGEWKQKSWMDSARMATFYDLKGIVRGLLSASNIKAPEFVPTTNVLLESESTETIQLGKKSVGYLGELKPSICAEWGIEEPVFYAEIAVHDLVDSQKELVRVQDLLRYPAIERDLSVVVAEDVKAGEIQKAIEKVKEPLLIKVGLFDLFRGGRVPKGHKSLAFRLTYQSPEKTLLSEDIQSIHQKIADQITQKFQASFQ